MVTYLLVEEDQTGNIKIMKYNLFEVYERWEEYNENKLNVPKTCKMLAYYIII